MDEKIIFKRDSSNIKKPYHLKNNVFLLYAPRNVKIEPAEFRRIDSGILTFIPNNSRDFITSKVRENEINETGSGEQRLRVEILNKSGEFPIEIKKGCVLGFFCSRTRTFGI